MTPTLLDNFSQGTFWIRDNPPTDLSDLFIGEPTSVPEYSHTFGEAAVLSAGIWRVWTAYWMVESTHGGISALVARLNPPPTQYAFPIDPRMTRADIEGLSLIHI